MNADLEERRVVLRDLNIGSLYEAFMMVSTFGGSLNGSTIHFEIDSFGWYYYYFAVAFWRQDRETETVCIPTAESSSRVSVSVLSDTVAVVVIVPVSVVGLLLMIIFVAMTSFSNNKRSAPRHTDLSCEAVLSFIL